MEHWMKAMVLPFGTALPTGVEMPTAVGRGVYLATVAFGDIPLKAPAVVTVVAAKAPAAATVPAAIAQRRARPAKDLPTTNCRCSIVPPSRLPFERADGSSNGRNN